MFCNVEMLKERYSNGEKPEYIFFRSGAVQAYNFDRHKIAVPVEKNCLGSNFEKIFRINTIRHFSVYEYLLYKRASVMVEPYISTPVPYFFILGSIPEEKIFPIKETEPQIKIWEEIKYDTAVRGNVAKFSQNPELLEYLMSTEDKVLVNMDTDNEWGANADGECDDLENPFNWKGKNLFGFAVMEAREIIRNSK